MEGSEELKREIVLKGSKSLKYDKRWDDFKAKFSEFSDHTLITLKLDISDSSKLAEFIFDLIRPGHEEKLILKYIRDKKLFFLKSKLNRLREKVREYLRDYSFGEYDLEARAKLELRNYIREKPKLELWGFVEFRMKYYKAAVYEAIEMSLADLELEFEHQKYIELLRCLVDIQKPKEEEISIIFDKNSCSLIDKDKNIIDYELIKVLGNEVAEEGIEFEDMLMGTLLTKAPKRIHIYKYDSLNDKFINMIENVFENKVRTYDRYRGDFKLVE